MKNACVNDFGFFRVAAAVPPVHVGNPEKNAKIIIEFVERAEKDGASVVVFPEMSLTGYALGDLFFQRLVRSATLEHLGLTAGSLLAASRNLTPAFIIGAPLSIEGKLFNTAMVIRKGAIHGIVPKTYLPGYREFYEERYFASARDLVAKEVTIGGERIPIGTDLLFRASNIPDVVFGIEICEDGWVPLRTSSFQALNGATIVFNPSASNDIVGKADYREVQVKYQSGTGICGYAYISCGVHEPTMDTVCGGDALIGENGAILSRSKRFVREGEMIIADIDIEHLMHDRERMTSFGEGIHECPRKDFRTFELELPRTVSSTLHRKIDPIPFVPSEPSERNKRCEEIFSIQTAGLARKVEESGSQFFIVAVSGGSDSTLALFVAAATTDLLGLPRKNVYALLMPGFGTDTRTYTNSKRLTEYLGVTQKEIDIQAGVIQHLKDLGHDPDDTESVVFQNAQARYRKMLEFDYANELRLTHGANAIVVGTSDMTEIWLGWSTYNGDNRSHYNVNCGVPKTLVRHLLRWIADTKVGREARHVVEDILETPISPGLIKTSGDKIIHLTEALVGPMGLHDFFIYHLVRWGSRPRKILFLGEHAWGTRYSEDELRKWLRVSIQKGFTQRWKSVDASEGPKVGTVSLSPRGDWRMPSDIDPTLWLKDLE